MDSSFSTQRLRAGNTFLANVAAAEYFVRRRMEGPYRDLVSLIQFGSQAYIVTPFTNDYENVLLSIALIGTPEEYDRFPDHGTLIMGAINRGVQLFETFDFLESSGNLIGIFRDGQDTHAVHQDVSLDEIPPEPAANEDAIIAAIEEIDRLAAGQIQVKQYVTRQPQFGPFALAAAGLWTLAATLGLGFSFFRRFP